MMENKVISKVMKGAPSGTGLVLWSVSIVVAMIAFGSVLPTGMNYIYVMANNSSILGTAGTALIGLTGLLVAVAFIMRIYRTR